MKFYEGYRAAVFKYFQNLFSSDGSREVDASLASVSPRVTLALNSNLLQEFTVEEINKALAQMQPLKAPGPEGYRVCFYQKHWSIIGGEVQQDVLNFLNNGMFDPSINYTYLALIPKSPNAANVCDYRPISLCNILYKLIAKTLANRLK